MTECITAPLILSLGALLGGVKNFTPRPLYAPRKIFRYPEHEAGGSGYGQNALDWCTRACLPHGPVVGEGKNIYQLFVWLLVQSTIIDAFVKYTSRRNSNFSKYSIFFYSQDEVIIAHVLRQRRERTTKGDSTKYGTRKETLLFHTSVESNSER
jgi:hypothetical protein